MKMPLVTIVIPVYKVEEYLDRCVESVVNQTYKDLEIILVDDGSPDRCPQMCDDWVKKDGRIKVIHQQNKGLSGARNTGIREAKGDWLYFLDSDDYIIPDCICLMMECVKKHPDVEMVCAGANATRGGFELFSFENRELPEYSDNRNWINRAMLQRVTLNMTSWNKLVLRKFILSNNVFFDEGYINEDDLWNFNLAKYLTRIAICKHDIYIYIIREGSITADSAKRYYNLIRLLRYFVNHITNDYRARQISFVYEFIRVHFNNETLKKYADDLRYVYDKMISEARGKQKIALWMYYKAPKCILNNYHVLGRVVDAIGKV